ncbi:MAG: cytochrome c1 [Xanthomonadales bacterium]|nr:cytochrome c1 [Xanthomonadales bacterium]HET9047645.1 cytochrome c1 [Chiayiivirga sp.]
MIKRLMAIGLLLVPALAFGSSGGALQDSQIKVNDVASMQRGAALFMNYCSGCHSLGLQRYSRMAADLNLTQEQVTQNLMFTDAKFGEPMHAAMTAAEGAKWFGKAPPDLSLVARNKPGGPDWTYTFLKSFYADPTRPSGWNNTLLVGASMPHVLWELQGVQHPQRDEAGHVEHLELTTPGTQSAAEYDRTVRDITNFLNYVGEPSAGKRRALGVWVIFFLVGFSVLAWLLKTEYWRDVH